MHRWLRYQTPYTSRHWLKKFILCIVSKKNWASMHCSGLTTCKTSVRVWTWVKSKYLCFYKKRQVSSFCDFPVSAAKDIHFFWNNQSLFFCAEEISLVPVLLRGLWPFGHLCKEWVSIENKNCFLVTLDLRREVFTRMITAARQLWKE